MLHLLSTKFSTWHIFSLFSWKLTLYLQTVMCGKLCSVYVGSASWLILCEVHFLSSLWLSFLISFLFCSSCPQGSSAARYPGFVWPFFQVLCGYTLWFLPETLHQRSPPAAHSQCPSKGTKEDQDGTIRVSGFDIRPKERHRCRSRSRRRGHVREARRGGETLPAPSPPHPQTYLHALRQASTRTAISLLPRQRKAWYGCRHCHW